MTQIITMADIRADPFYSYSVGDLQLSVRTTNCCQNESLDYVAEIIQRTEWEFLQVPNFAHGCLDELKTALTNIGRALDTVIEDAPPWLGLRAELEKLRDEREAKLSPLLQSAAPEKARDPPLEEWLKQAKSMLTPALLGRMENERHRTVIAGRIQEPRLTFKKLGEALGVTGMGVQVMQRKGVRELKRIIRSELLPGGR